MVFADDFAEFIDKYNVTGMAIGFITGLAARDLINAFVDDLINPLIGIFVQRVDFSAFALEAFGSKFLIGAFVNSLIKFLLIFLVIFITVKYVVKASPKPKKGGGKK